MKSFITQLIQSKHNMTRSSNIVKNISVSFIIKGFSVVLSFLLVPLTVNSLKTEDYGIWLTISSLLSWIGFFDIGLGNGLRNCLAAAFADQNKQLARIYVSTTFFLISCIASGIFLIFTIFNSFIDWNKVLNTMSLPNKEFRKIMFWIVLFFCVQFIFKIVNSILLADQKSSRNDILNLCSQALSFIIILALIYFFKNTSLFSFSCAFSAAPVLVFLVISVIMFTRNYAHLQPSFRFIQLKYSKSLIGLGLSFFIIQVSTLVIYATSNIIIIQLFGPSEVSVYNIAYKLYSAVTMIFSIIIIPFWSATTNAYIKKDYSWMRKTANVLLSLWLCCSFVILLIVFFSKLIIKLWIGSIISIPLSVNLAIGIYMILLNFFNMYSFLLNGIGKIRISVILSVIQILVFFPFAFLFGKYFGVSGIPVALSASLLPFIVILPIQYNKIVNFKATGIWDR